MTILSLSFITAALSSYAIAAPTESSTINLPQASIIPALGYISNPPAGYVHPPKAPVSPTLNQFTPDEFKIWAGNANATSTEPPPEVETEIFEKRDVIGTDDRYLVVDTKVYPFAAVGRLYMPFNGGYYWCSGFLVGPRLMAAARHCIASGVDSFTFQPGYSNGNVFASTYATSIYWIANDDSIGNCDIKNDWALFVLNDPLGTQHGYFGVRNYADDRSIVENKAVLFNEGYPGDYTVGGQLPYMSDSRTSALSWESSCANGGPVLSDCDVAGGMSGGPYWLRQSESRWAYGPAVGETSTYTVHAHGPAFVQTVNTLNAQYPS